MIQSLRQAISDWGYWPKQHAIGFLRVWQFNGPLPALQLTRLNLFGGKRRLFRLRFGEFVIELRSGTPDLAVAVDSLGREFRALDGLPDPAGLIIDAGGYIGTTALRLAAAFPRSKIITIEPSRDNLEMLRRNVGSVPNIAVMEAALAAHEGQVMLNDGGAGHWGFSILADVDGRRKGRPLGAVPTVTVDTILAHERRDRLFLLKLDVEGAEVAILQASGGWMERTDFLIAELHERIVPGAAGVFEAATRGRKNRRLPGEKVMSVAAGSPVAPGDPSPSP